MDTRALFARARQLIAKPNKDTVSTADLCEYIGYNLITPLGIGVIKSVIHSYTRRVNNKTYNVYTITIKGTSIKRITTYADTQWRID